MKTNKKLLLSFVFLFSLFSYLSLASVQLIFPSNTETDAGIMQLINLSISGLNVSNVTIILPTGFNYVENSNGTSSVNATNFSYFGNQLIWKNGTYSIIDGNESFWFNVTTWTNLTGESNLTIIIANSTNTTEENITIIINPTLWSNYGEFYVKPTSIILNWSNNYQANVTLYVNNTLNYSIQVGVDNVTTEINGNYSQREMWRLGRYGTKYGPQPSGYCFPYSGNSIYDNPVSVKVNNTGTNKTTILSTSQQPNITFIQTVICPPGKYFGSIILYNLTNPLENLSLPITIHIPISTENILRNSTGKGTFYGRISSNQNYYHSYFFNTSNITNATYAYISLNWTNSSKDIDLFVIDYDTGNLLAKSINKSGFEEVYINLTPGKIYEIRIYGNVSQEDYTGFLSFSTLKLLNASNLSHQISKISFGTLNITNSSTLNLTLKNVGSINFSNIKQEIVIYHLDTFYQNNGNANNFTFFVPSFANKIKVSVNWTGNASYNLSLYNPSGTLIDYSSHKQNIANIANVEKEEFVETTNVNEGYWKIQVSNLTNDTNSYTVIAKFYVNPNWWFSSNYSSSGYNFNYSTTNHTFNLTLSVPKNATSGIYKGYIRYHGSGGIEIPFELNVSTSTFLINGSTKNATIIINDNIGFNRSIVFNITIKNIGNKNLTFDQITNSSNLTGATGGYIDFDFNLSSEIIKPNETVNLTINITLDTTKTKDNKTIYTGWINFTSNNSAPYQNFVLILKVNLTDLLKVNILNITTSLGNYYINANKDENVTVQLEVFYINGTEIESVLKLENFSDAKIVQNKFLINNQYYSFPLTNLYSGNSPSIWTGNEYKINVTIPTNSSNIPGGNYTFYINVTYNSNNSGKVYTYKGQGSWYPLIINASGFYMNSTQSSISVDNQSSKNFTISIYNYGPVADTTTLHFNKGSCSIQITNVYCSSISCNSSSDKLTVNLSAIQGYDLSGNVSVTWTIKGDCGEECYNCYAKIYGASRWYNNLSFYIDVDATEVEEEEEETTETETQYTFEEEEEEENITLVANFTFYSYEDTILIRQNSTNSTIIKIKNNGDVNQTVSLDIEGINESWFSISPYSQTIKPTEIKEYNVTFEIEFPEIKDYSGRYKATSPNMSLTKTFTLKVLPSIENETKLMEEINKTELNLSEIEKEIENLKKEGYNVQDIESIYNLTKENLEKIKNYIKEKKYSEAYSLLEEVKSYIEILDESIEKAKIPPSIFDTILKFLWKYGIYILIPIIFVGIGLLIYMLLPPEEVKPKIIKKELITKGGIKKKINNEYEKLKEKWKGKIKK